MVHIMTDGITYSINVGERGASIIRWAGSKKKILPLLSAMAPLNYARYIEPFCGSAALLFYLKPRSAFLGDINFDLINALVAIRDHPADLYAALAAVHVSKESYYRIRAAKPEPANVFEQAVRFLYLNRYCFNGIYRTNRLGQFNVPMGERTGGLPPKELFLSCSSVLKGADLLVGDFCETLDYATANDFVYLDPPYVKEGTRNRGEYGVGSFIIADIERLMTRLHQLDVSGVRFLLSYANHDAFVCKLPSHWEVHKIEVGRHISGFCAKQHHASEILVRNYSTDSRDR